MSKRDRWHEEANRRVAELRARAETLGLAWSEPRVREYAEDVTREWERVERYLALFVDEGGASVLGIVHPDGVDNTVVEHEDASAEDLARAYAWWVRGVLPGAARATWEAAAERLLDAVRARAAARGLRFEAPLRPVLDEKVELEWHVGARVLSVSVDDAGVHVLGSRLGNGGGFGLESKGASADDVALAYEWLVDERDASLRHLQREVAARWGSSKYNAFYRGDPRPHRDFAHARLHVGIADGASQKFLDGCEHEPDVLAHAARERVAIRNKLADVIICAMQQASTYPGEPIDALDAVLDRLAEKFPPRRAVADPLAPAAAVPGGTTE